MSNLFEAITNIQMQPSKSKSKSKTKTIKKSSCVGAGAFIYNPQNQSVLVVHGPIKWSLPKGHSEVGELSHQVAEREIFEETSLQLKLTPEWRSKKIKKYVYYYVVLENATDLHLVALDQHEIKDLKWCTYQELLLLDCNKQLKYFRDNWLATIEILTLNQSTLTYCGTTPTPEECQEQINRIMSKIRINYHDAIPSD